MKSKQKSKENVLKEKERIHFKQTGINHARELHYYLLQIIFDDYDNKIKPIYHNISIISLIRFNNHSDTCLNKRYPNASTCRLKVLFYIDEIRNLLAYFPQ